jgi:LPXTG-motif cell wall-anchored protein
MRTLYNMVQPRYASSSQESRALHAYETGQVRPELILAAAPEFERMSAPPLSPKTEEGTSMLLIGGAAVALAAVAGVMWWTRR